jgi:hypothetical protein
MSRNERTAKQRLHQGESNQGGLGRGGLMDCILRKIAD